MQPKKTERENKVCGWFVCSSSNAKRNRGVDSIVSGLSMLSTHTLNFNSFIILIKRVLVLKRQGRKRQQHGERNWRDTTF